MNETDVLLIFFRGCARTVAQQSFEALTPLLDEPHPPTTKLVIQCFTAIYPVLFRWLCVRPFYLPSVVPTPRTAARTGTRARSGTRSSRPRLAS
jgi:hypothetical protein